MSLHLNQARAEALFHADVPMTDRLSRSDVDRLVARQIRCHNGLRGCVCDMAAEFGDHPDTAVARMRWAITTVEQLYRVRLKHWTLEAHPHGGSLPLAA